MPIEELELWEAISKEKSWSAEDCLKHKLSFPKRCDTSKKIDGFVAHMKKLRAAGWFLVNSLQASCRETEEVRALLEKERERHAGETKAQEERLLVSNVENEELKQQLEGAESTVSRRNAEIESCRKELTEAVEKLNMLEEAHRDVCEKLDNQRRRNEELREKLEKSEILGSEAQKYATSLQSFNSKLQQELAESRDSFKTLQNEKIQLSEEISILRGRVSTLVDTVTDLQRTSQAAESSRLEALEDAARLRADLMAATTERSSLVEDISRLRDDSGRYRNELDRFRKATGKELAQLEAEREAHAMLSTRTEAQAATLVALQEQVAMLREQKMASEVLADTKASECRALTSRVTELEGLLDLAERRARDAENVRRKLHNTILELKGNVRVFCRVRPVLCGRNESEEYMEKTNTLKRGIDHSVVHVHKSGEDADRSIEIAQPAKDGRNEQKHRFTFDAVFPPDSSQEEVFEEVSALVQSTLDGYKVCLFAYGQTGAGKTHTMIGTEADGQEGVIPRAVRQVFSTAEASTHQGWRYTMRAAMLEIYNEEIRDLLGKGPPKGKKHAVSHETVDGEVMTSVSFLEWYDVDSPERLSLLIKKAMSQRAVGATACNEQSSRSHMVFMLRADGHNDTTGQRLRGTLNLVDLAGSERLGKSGAEGVRLKETQAINKSLSALGDVIAALGAKEAHVPYRNSKLTYLLQGSLGGSGKALMLCNISPRAEDGVETLGTLRFAAKVNACEIGTARRNIMSVG